MNFTTVVDWISRALELLGVAVIVIGFISGGVMAAVRLARGERDTVYAMIRKHVGQSILLGLEVLVAADLIRTILVETTIQTVVALAIIVLIRTLLSFSLEIELYGRVPWKGSRESQELARSREKEAGGAAPEAQGLSNAD